MSVRDGVNGAKRGERGGGAECRGHAQIMLPMRTRSKRLSAGETRSPVSRSYMSAAHVFPLTVIISPGDAVRGTMFVIDGVDCQA